MGFDGGYFMDTFKNTLYKIKLYVIKNKVHVAYILIIAAILVVGFLMFQNKLVSQHKIPPVTTIQDTASTDIASGQTAINKYEGKADAADVSHLISHAVQQQPTAVYITTTQAAADTKAQQMAAKDKTDYVLKQPTNTATQISNNYYAITQERKHRIAVGAAEVNSKAYAAIAYTNRDTTITAYSKDMRGIDGVSVMYTVAKW